MKFNRIIRALLATCSFFILSSAGALSAAASMQADYWPADDWVSTGSVRTVTITYNYSGLPGWKNRTVTYQYGWRYGDSPQWGYPSVAHVDVYCWYDKPIGDKSGHMIASGDFVPKKNTTVYLKWEYQTYTIWYDSNGGTGTMKNQTFKYGSSKTLRSNAFKRPGYVFKGWATWSGGSVVYKNGQSIKPTYNMTLYAVWKPKTIKITYDFRGLSGWKNQTVSYTYGSSYRSSSKWVVPTSDRRVIEGWYDKPKGEKGARAISGWDDVPSKSKTIYLWWSYIPRYVTFEANGGKGTMKRQKLKDGISQALSKNAFKWTGYVFKGWAKSPGGKVVYRNGQSVKIHEDMTLYAIWAWDGKTAWLKVVKTGAGATGSKVAPSSATTQGGRNVRLKAMPAKATEEHSASLFLGWYSDSACKKILSKKTSYGYTVPKKKNVTVYALFESRDRILPWIDCASTYSFTPGDPFRATIRTGNERGDAVTLKITGLPKGLSSKNGVITGAPKACAKNVIATVTATSHGVSAKKKVTFVPVNPGFGVDVTFTEDNGRESSVREDEEIETYVGLPVTINVHSTPGEAGVSKSAATVTASGLKNGLEFKSGKITGTPTKTGVQKVKLTFKNVWGWQTTYSFRIRVIPLPAWFMGTYNGEGRYGSARGTATLTVGATGKVSGKIVANGKSYAIAGKRVTDYNWEDDVFVADVTVNGKSKATLTFVSAYYDEAGHKIGVVTASGDDFALTAWQNVFTRDDLPVPAFVADKTLTLTYDELLALGVKTKSGDTLSLKVDAKGVAKVAGQLAGKTVSASCPCIVEENGDGAATAQVVVPYGAKTLIVNLLLADGERPSAYGW